MSAFCPSPRPIACLEFAVCGCLPAAMLRFAEVAASMTFGCSGWEGGPAMHLRWFGSAALATILATSVPVLAADDGRGQAGPCHWSVKLAEYVVHLPDDTAEVDTNIVVWMPLPGWMAAFTPPVMFPAEGYKKVRSGQTVQVNEEVDRVGVGTGPNQLWPLLIILQAFETTDQGTGAPRRIVSQAQAHDEVTLTCNDVPFTRSWTLTDERGRPSSEVTLSFEPAPKEEPDPARGSRRLSECDDVGSRLQLWDAEVGGLIWTVDSSETLHAVSRRGDTFATGRYGSGSRGVTKARSYMLDTDHVKVWGTATGVPLRTIKFDTGERGDTVRVSSNLEWAVVRAGPYDTQSRCELWDLRAGRSVQTTDRANCRPYAVSPDGAALIWMDSEVVWWDPQNGVQRPFSPAITMSPPAGALSPDGTRVVAPTVRPGPNSTVRGYKLFDTATGDEIVSLDGLSTAVLAVAFSDDAQTLAASNFDGSVYIVDLRTGSVTQQIRVPNGGAQFIALSPGGDKLLTSPIGMISDFSSPWLEMKSFGRLRLWELPSGRLLRTFPERGEWQAEFLPGGKRFVVRWACRAGF